MRKETKIRKKLIELINLKEELEYPSDNELTESQKDVDYRIVKSQINMLDWVLNDNKEKKKHTKFLNNLTFLDKSDLLEIIIDFHTGMSEIIERLDDNDSDLTEEEKGTIEGITKGIINSLYYAVKNKTIQNKVASLFY